MFSRKGGAKNEDGLTDQIGKQRQAYLMGVDGKVEGGSRTADRGQPEYHERVQGRIR
jgi:hypothetical protein